MIKKMPITLTLDSDVITAIDRKAAEARLQRSAWLNQFLAERLLGAVNPEEAATPPEAPMPPKRKRGGGR